MTLTRNNQNEKNVCLYLSLLSQVPFYAATAKRRLGKFSAFFFSRPTCAFSCTAVNRRRIARVFLGRKSLGTYFFFAYVARASVLFFWLYTVSTRAMPFRTMRIFANFDAAPPDTFATCGKASVLFF